MIMVLKGVEIMEQTLKKSLSLALLVSAFAVNAGSVPVVSAYKLRPQSLNGARKVAGEVPGDGYTHMPDMDEWYASFSVTPEYQKSFRSSNIARSLFGDALIGTGRNNTTSNSCDNDCGEVILIQGLGVENRNEKALIAENFYLANDYSSALTVKPVISNFILDFNFYGGLDEWVKGLYFRVYAPFVHTKWNLHMTEKVVSTIDTTDTTDFKTATEYFSGMTPPQQTEKLGVVGEASVTPAVVTNVTRNPLAFNKMNGSIATEGSCESTCSESETQNGFGEIRAEFGYDFLRCENYHMGMYLAAAAPTGNKRKAEFLFAPTVGNGKHWELGAGLTAHWVFWRCESEESHFGLYTDMVVTHLFNAKEQRVFDLKGKPLSRYMLAAKMNDEATGLLGGNPTEALATPAAAPAVNPANRVNATVQFANVLTPIANLTAQDINVSVGAQMDLTAWLNYTSGGFSWDLGYNLWFQTCEKFGCVDKCGPQLATDKNTWVAITDPHLLYGDSGAGADVVSFPLSLSQSTSTITSNGDVDGTPTLFAVNNPTTPGGATDTPLRLQGLPSPINGANQQAEITVNPVFLSVADIDLEQKSKGLSNKVFTNFQYTWDRECWTPFVGIGGEAEFGSGRKCEDTCSTTPVTTNDCKSCLSSAVSQWGVWAKVGLSFN
ncbi:MAG: hypothetical protein NT124_01815 [Candidatus Dependentiae bacterium]|nr:hypothetical protein [Candidatus Dependentiae bacterium]